MDMLTNLSSLAKSDNDEKKSDPKSDNSQQKSDSKSEDGHHRKSSDIMHSAQVLADVAQSKLRKEPGKYDTAEVAGATADLIDVASHYANLDDTQGIGKYVDKAEDYLRQYHTSNSHPASDAHAKPNIGKTTGDDDSTDKPGAGDFMKMAGDFHFKNLSPRARPPLVTLDIFEFEF